MTTAKTKSGRRAGRFFWAAAIVLVLIAGAGALWWRAAPHQRAAERPPAPVPVTVASVTQQDVPIVLDALGTVQAMNSIAVRTQIDGPLQSVNFVEGQEVKQGDTLAVIDPRPLQAALDQAKAKKGEDEAQLVGAQKDLDRAKQLAARGYGPVQAVDQQQAKVDQLKATIEADQAAIESAATQLSYTTIKAPIGGRVGFRQVDPGNIVHVNDTSPITVLTQIRPAQAVFTLPQKNLGDVREAMLRGPVPVRAFDQDNRGELARGELLLIDNQIDTTTSTIRLKARFPNDDERLWPGEFVRLRVEVDTRKDAVTIPPVALQRGPNGFYVWVVTAQNKADQRPVEAAPINDDVVIVTKGVSPGEHVVVNGQYRLQAGSPVEAKTAEVATAAEKGS